MHTNEKIVTWNIRHGGGNRVDAIVKNLIDKQPDTILLTEFRNNQSGSAIINKLKNYEYEYHYHPDVPKTTNTLLLASKIPFDIDHSYDSSIDGSYRFIIANFKFITICGFYFPNKTEKEPFFKFITSMPDIYLKKRTVLIGDFNTGKHFKDEEGATFLFAEYFDKFEEQGWVDSWRMNHNDRREYSWFSNRGNGFRLDHIFISPSLKNCVEQVEYSHKERELKISDHSMMSICLELKD